MAIALLVSAVWANVAKAAAVTSYGAGLLSCADYVDARSLQNMDEIPFIEWFSGYISGVNATSTHTNDVLGDTNLREPVGWLVNYCRAHPVTNVAQALGVLLFRATASSARTSPEVTLYGAGFQSCETYLHARQQKDPQEEAFIDWLGGYLSGVNAISLRTNNVLGNSDLTAAIYWLDAYCQAKTAARFADAVAERVARAWPASGG